jgi:hypothetical protein
MQGSVYPTWRVVPGIAAEDYDREKNDGYLRILCVLDNPFEQGKVAVKERQSTLTDIEDVWGTSPGTITEINTIPAKYLAFNTNGTVPDIVLGETVLVYQYGNNNQQRYWIPTGKEKHIRFNEHYELRFADEKLVLKSLTDENSYYIKFNTYDGEKIVEIGTSLSDGETYRFRFTLDPINSIATLNDMEGGNEITLSSVDPFILVKNRNGTLVDVFRDDVFIHGVRDVHVDAGRLIKLKAPNIKIEADAADFSIGKLGITGQEICTIGSLYSINSVLHATAGIQTAICAVTALTIAGAPPPGTPTSISDVGSYREVSDTDEVATETSNNNALPSPTGRHSAAYEQVTEAIQAITEALVILANRPNVPNVNVAPQVTAALRAASQSIMQMNRGT